MMCEIIDHQDSPDFGLHIHSAFHAAERRKCVGNLRGWEAASMRNDERCHGVQDVMASRGGQRKFSEQLSMMRRPKLHGFAIDSEAACHPIIPIVEAVRCHRAESFFRRESQGRARIVRVAPNDHATAPRNRKSTRLNSSHANISYAVFCLKKKKQELNTLFLTKKKKKKN